MYLINAVFNKEHLKEIVKDLLENNIQGITILKAYSKGEIGLIENNHSNKDMNEKIKLEIVVSTQEIKELVMEIIRSECQDLGYGAGKIWITEVIEVERIRTGEKNESALKNNKKEVKNNNAYTDNEFYNSEDTPST